MASNVLAAPFALADAALLAAAVQALTAVTIHAWPRVLDHRGEMLEGLLICWCRIEGEENPSEELRQVQRAIEETVRLVTAILKGQLDVTEEYRLLMTADPRLRSLLSSV